MVTLAGKQPTATENYRYQMERFDRDPVMLTIDSRLAGFKTVVAVRSKARFTAASQF
jgi:hypothetical protein